MVLFDDDAVVDFLATCLDMRCNVLLLIEWRKKKIDLREVVKVQVLAVPNEAAGCLKRLDVSRTLEQIAKEISVHRLQWLKDHVG